MEKVYILFYNNGDVYPEDKTETIVGVFNSANDVNNFLEKHPVGSIKKGENSFPNRCEIWEGEKCIKTIKLITRLKEE